MARITVEDCVLIVPNRFELCLIASNRAKSVLSGARTMMDKKEKPAVIALREIADYVVDVEIIKKSILRNIKNLGSSEQETIISNETSEVIAEELEDQDIVLKGSMFVEDNMQIDD